MNSKRNHMMKNKKIYIKEKPRKKSINFDRKKNIKFKRIKDTVIISFFIILCGLFYTSYTYFFKTDVEPKKNEILQANAQEINENKKDKESAKSSKNTPVIAYDIEKIKAISDNKGEKDGKKIAFLTFDDGPSPTVTPKVLDVLKDNNIKATFFTVGKNIDSNNSNKNLIKRISEEGHAIANHSYSHNLKKLYPNNKLDVNAFITELEKTNNILKDILGQDFNARAIRMPGGYMSRVYYKDPNLNEFNEKLKERDMYSIDWNAYIFDSEGKKKTAPELVEAFKNSVGTQEKIVVLMHDTYGKEETAKALPGIIDYLKSNGYEFQIIK